MRLLCKVNEIKLIGTDAWQVPSQPRALQLQGKDLSQQNQIVGLRTFSTSDVLVSHYSSNTGFHKHKTDLFSYRRERQKSKTYFAELKWRCWPGWDAFGGSRGESLPLSFPTSRCYLPLSLMRTLDPPRCSRWSLRLKILTQSPHLKILTQSHLQCSFHHLRNHTHEFQRWGDGHLWRPLLFCSN